MFNFLSTPIEIETKLLLKHSKNFQLRLHKDTVYEAVIQLWSKHGLMCSTGNKDVEFKKTNSLMPRELSTFIKEYKEMIVDLLLKSTSMDEISASDISNKIAKLLLLGRHIEEKKSWQKGCLEKDLL